MTAGIDFALHMIGVWAGEDAGRMIELLMEYAPQPPFGLGRPEIAPAETLNAATAIAQQLMPNEIAVAMARRRGFLA